jgi:hypothetical protein
MLRLMTALVITGITLTALASMALADPPATQPGTQPGKPDADSPEVKAVRDQLVQWDKTQATNTLEQERKTYHTENDKEAQYLDFVAHDNWEEGKAQKAVRDKWGPDVEAKFAHIIGASTQEDDAVCGITVDGNSATATWDNIKGATPLKLIKVDGHWLVDGHALYAEAVKDDPNSPPVENPSGPMMKQVVKDIADGKFDDADSFLADFKAKLGQDGN